jgi:YD repeat-containing protein
MSEQPKPARRSESARQNFRRKVAMTMAILFIGANEGPMLVALAMPSVFFKVGAGVSNIPLQASAFNAPGFGGLSNAINLATGNVYLGMDGMSMNNTLGANDETTNTVGGSGWNVTARKRLQGYSKTMAASPASFTLASGDGSAYVYSKKTLVAADWTNAPSWIKRYQTLPDLNTATFIYASQPRVGTQYSSEWIVLRMRGSGATATNIAHHYDQSGNRTSFFNDGEYADYAQSRAEQFRGAKYNTDPEGEVTTAKTEITYTALNSGRISKIKDAWGRVTTYEWDTVNGVVNAINYLLRTETDNTTWTKRTEFLYTVIGTQRLVSSTIYKAGDGLGATVSRKFDFEYVSQNGKVLLWKARRPVLGGGAGLYQETVYTYDTSSRVTQVTQTGEPNTVYAYNAGGNTYSNGIEVIVAQGTGCTSSGVAITCTDVNRKEVRNYFDTSSQLMVKRERNYNPYNAANTSISTTTGIQPESWLQTSYEYYGAGTNAQGSTKAVVLPSGRREEFDYNVAGQVIEQRTLTLNTANALVNERTRQMTYDTENIQRLDRLVGTSGTRDGVAYAYGNKEIKTYVDIAQIPAVSVNSQAFSVVGYSVNEYWDGSEKFREITNYDEYGRTTQVERATAGGASSIRKTTFAFGDGTGKPITYPDANGLPVTNPAVIANAVQYGNMVTSSTLTSANTDTVVKTIVYDALGNPNKVTVTNGVTVDWSGSTQTRLTHQTLMSTNGFGQGVWKQVQTTGAVAADNRIAQRTMNTYYTTGELDASWNGTPANVTDYRYVNTTGNSDIGRMNAVVKGVGASGGITAAHETTTFGFDLFGRVSSQVKDGFTTSFVYAGPTGTNHRTWWGHQGVHVPPEWCRQLHP